MADARDGLKLASDIDRHQELFGEVFNSGDADAVNAMYTDDAIGVWEPGKPLSGSARREYVTEFIASRKPTVDATVLETYVTGDTAMLIVDWTMDTVGPDGGREQLAGVAVDVLRRGDDGNWRYVVDSPYAIRGPAEQSS